MKKKLINWLGTLRFPVLLLITGTLFLLDLFIPDVVPFVDEIVLALVTVLLSRLKRDKTPQKSAEEPRK